MFVLADHENETPRKTAMKTDQTNSTSLFRNPTTPNTTPSLKSPPPDEIHEKCRERCENQRLDNSLKWTCFRMGRQRMENPGRQEPWQEVLHKPNQVRLKKLHWLIHLAIAAAHLERFAEHDLGDER